MNGGRWRNCHIVKAGEVLLSEASRRWEYRGPNTSYFPQLLRARPARSSGFYNQETESFPSMESSMVWPIAAPIIIFTPATKLPCLVSQ